MNPATFNLRIRHESACHAAITRHIEHCDVCCRWDTPGAPSINICPALAAALNEMLIATVLRIDAEQQMFHRPSHDWD